MRRFLMRLFLLRPFLPRPSARSAVSDPRRDVRAADLQEEPTKGSRTEPILQCSRFVGSDEDGGSRRTSQRAKRAIRHSELGKRGSPICRCRPRHSR
jgi:hypothetical protein